MGGAITGYLQEFRGAPARCRGWQAPTPIATPAHGSYHSFKCRMLTSSTLFLTMNSKLKVRFGYFLPFLLVVLGACSDDPLAPFQPEITNATDSFQMQATGLTNVTYDKTYSWNNTGQQATVNHSTTIMKGSAHLTIRDAAGVVVYDKGMMPSLNEPTAMGTSGTWKIHVHLSGCSGTLNFRVQKL